MMNSELDLNIDGKYYNNLDVVGFSQMLKDPSYCYKFYWLEAIVKMISRDVEKTSFNDIIDEMICNAWYSVKEFHIHLSGMPADGQVKDGLERAVLKLSEASSLNAAASKVEIKNAIKENMLYCNVDEDGIIYLCNGQWLFRMTPAEYAAIAAPATNCDPANWIIDKHGKKDGNPENCFINIYKKYLADFPSEKLHLVQRSPLEQMTERNSLMLGFYSFDTKEAYFYNKSFVDSLQPATILATNATGPAFVGMNDGGAVAIILPIRAQESARRAVKAYFTEPSDAEQKNNNAEQLQQQNAEQAEQLQRAEAMREALANKITELCDEITSRNNEIEALKKQIEQQPAAAPAATEQPAPDLKTAAEMIAERFRAFAGVEAVIKGATTSAPVVWLKGNTKQHENEITAAGAKWSGKKSAYYIKVA